MSTVMLLLLILATFRLSCACVAMKPKDFDDVMPLTRIPPTNPLWTTEALPTTSIGGETTSVNMATTSQSMETTGTSTASTSTTSTSTTSTTTTTRDPCDDCMIPTELIDTACGLRDPLAPAIMISALPNGMNCELVASGCVLYDILLTNGDCTIDTFSSNPICQNGVFTGGTVDIAISKIRCNS